MKKLMPVILITLLIAIPCFSKQADTERELARTQEFISATQKSGAAKISALNAYIKKFPETTSRWTQLAYYHLAVEYFQTQKYSQAVEYSNKILKLGSLSEGEEGRLYLIIANSYGVKSASIFDKDKALEMANKAISFAQANKLNDVLAEAQKLKRQLAGPSPKKRTPEQQIKMYYSEGSHKALISCHAKLSPEDKNKKEIRGMYADSCLKTGRCKDALQEYKALYKKDQKGENALGIGNSLFCICMKEQKKKKQKRILLNSAADYYLEASVLYNKEDRPINAKVALSKAKECLSKIYGLITKNKLNELLEKAKKRLEM
jgi:hypothetical protein